MDQKIIQSLKEALTNKKLIRVAHTLDQGIDQTVLNIPQEIWYKYPTVGEGFIKAELSKKGINCVRPFTNSHRDREYTYDHLIWKMMADKYIEKMGKEPVFFSYKKSTNLEEACKEYGFKEIMPDYKLFKEIQYKSQLQNFGVSKGAGLITFFEEHLDELTYDEVQKKLGEKFVVQFSFSPSGWNTTGCNDTNIVSNKEQFELVKKESTHDVQAKLSKFIDGYGVCMNVVNTEKGPVTSDLFLQTIEKIDHNVMDHGVNFEEGRTFISEKAQTNAEQIAKNIGNTLYKKSYKGYFGIDMLVEKGTDEVYVLEINPRFTGSTMNQSFLSNIKGKTPLIALHFCEYLECLPQSFDPDIYRESTRGLWEGGQFYIVNQEEDTAQVKSAPQPGIYKINDNSIEFIKEAYDFEELPKDDHFLIRRVCPLDRNVTANNVDDPICIVYSREKVFEKDKCFTDKYIKVRSEIYKQFSFEPKNTYDSSVPYKAII